MKKNAFTLIELLVVISIIGIIIGMAFVAFQETKKSARDTQRKAGLEDIRSALEVFKADCGHYPVSLPAAGSSLRGDGTSSTCSASNTYMFAVPSDPNSNRGYYYGQITSVKYDLCSSLENVSTNSASCSGSCGDFDCNYKVTNP